MKSLKDYIAEEIRRYGAVGNSPGMGRSINESHMAEVDLIIQDIINGELDAYDIMAHPKTPEEDYVSRLLQDEYEKVSIDHRLHPDDNFEEILDIVVDRLADDYKHDVDINESINSLSRAINSASNKNKITGN